MPTYCGKDVFNDNFEKLFLFISLKNESFRDKGRPFGITFKKYFFSHISENNNISWKITLFSDHFDKIDFCTYVRKYEHFEENYTFFLITEKIIFCPHLAKYQHFAGTSF